jgi:hypothetical protein
MDKFSWVGSFSAGGTGDDFAAAFPEAGEKMNQELHVLWIACGTEDRLIEPNRKLIAWLKAKGVNVIPVETPGMHTWMVWRHNLISFVPLLFQESTGRVRVQPIRSHKRTPAPGDQTRYPRLISYLALRPTLAAEMHFT